MSSSGDVVEVFRMMRPSVDLVVFRGNSCSRRFNNCQASLWDRHEFHGLQTFLLDTRPWAPEAHRQTTTPPRKQEFIIRGMGYRGSVPPTGKHAPPGLSVDVLDLHSKMRQKARARLMQDLTGWEVTERIRRSSTGRPFLDIAPDRSNQETYLRPTSHNIVKPQ